MKTRIQTRSFGLLLALATLSVIGTASGQNNPLGQPLLDANGEVREDAFIHIPLQAEDRIYSDIDGLWMKQLVLELNQISLDDRASGRQFWGRNIGTDAHAISQDWAENYFRQFGLQNIERKTFALDPVWELHRWDISFNDGSASFKLASARPPEKTASTAPAGQEYELVWLGTGTEADYLGRDVNGKAVLIQDIPWPGTLRHSIQLEGAVERAYEQGAGAVGIVYGISDNFAVWQRTANKPGFNLGYEDGVRLRDLLGTGKTVTVRLQYDSGMTSGLTADSVIGMLPGTSAENIIILAHVDGYFQAASDNASGMAVMMGLIRHFAALTPAQRGRNLIFMSSVGHHSGPGARWLHDEKDTALADTALLINLEHVAIVRTKYWGPKLRKMNAVSPMRWWVWGSPALLHTTLDAFNRFNVGITADMDPGASGEMGAVDEDVPSLQVITSPEIKHTEQDTPDWVPAVGLEQIGRAYARIIDGANQMQRSELQPQW